MAEANQEVAQQPIDKSAIFQNGVNRGFLAQIGDLSSKVAELSGNLEVLGSDYKDLHQKHQALQKSYDELVAKHTTPETPVVPTEEVKQDGATS